MKKRPMTVLDERGKTIYLSYDDYGDLNSEVWEEDGVYSARIHTPDGVKKIRLSSEDGKRIIEITRESYNDEHRETRRHVSLESMDPEERSFAEDFDPLNELEDEERIKILMEAVRKLPSSQQDVLKAYYWEGKTGVEIAEEKNKTTSAVYTQLKREIETLRKAIISNSADK